MSPKVSIVATDSHRDPGPRPGADVTFLPLADDDGVPIYDESIPDLIQHLQTAGLSADTWHPAAECDFVSSRGLVTDALVQIGVGIGSSAGWYALQSLLRRRGGQVRVVAVFDDGTQRRRAEVTGEAADVVEALEKLDPFSSEPS
ncbi:hypothetical protein M8C17_17800 [Micromonospora sp. RHAY321]|uniref:hypothetical protein n=1 Tax=Micromonospora sp. RHAY321 TaxID=2944807 RepID=UPI00207C7AE5|nr:hypothetical protein [Micromonospora sp. RHAY321]MCO1597012.1 hypothetical protein [Micromonospora sp. RHAY321]